MEKAGSPSGSKRGPGEPKVSTSVSNEGPAEGADRRLFRLLWLSVAAAVLTIALKTAAWIATDSVGLLSDALESVVNLVAAVTAIGALYLASRPPDDNHAYGHAKAEYFSAGIEGALIFLAAIYIGGAAIQRLLDPRPLSDIGVGLAVSVVASLINLAVGLILLRTGRRERSITLEANGKHLFTDVLTSAGVVVGVSVAGLTGWQSIDPIIAIGVAFNIIYIGISLVRRSVAGLMDTSLDDDVKRELDRVLASFSARGVRFHAVRTRQGGRRAFVSTHVLVPGWWTVQHGHDLVEDVEDEIRRVLPYATVFTHLEPDDDPRSFEDMELDRRLGPGVSET